jgi:hypothetical protein
MSGLLSAYGGIALNSTTAQSAGLTYVLGIKAFAEGGNIVWSSASDVSVGYATNAGHATTADTAYAVFDYGNTANKIKIGFAGSSLTSFDYFAVYGTNSSGERVIKDASLAAVAAKLTQYTTSGKNYKVQSDGNGYLYVNVPWTDTDTNTWQANTASQNGYVTAGSGNANKVWKTDSSGNPAWRTDSNTNYYHTPSYSSGLSIASGTGVNALYVPDATDSQSGVVSTAAQTFAGAKTFSGAMTVNNTITFGTSDSYGIRTNSNNYCRIGASGKCFFELYVNRIYCDSSSVGRTIGTSSTPFPSVYATTFYATSDFRKKKDLRNYEVNEDILSLPLYQFKYINNNDEREHIGCIAQDLQKICPELVEADEDGFLSIKENKLVYILLDRMKKMQKEIDELKEAK